MCGIIGFTGMDNALPRLLSGLSALEYRGYDSAGVAFFRGAELMLRKAGGRLDNLRRQLERELTCGQENSGHIRSGIGHTRWATHGEPSDANSHPHGNGRVYAVHNGIIENYVAIGEDLESLGYSFTSDTDTERAVLLIDRLYSQMGDPVAALHAASEMLQGSFALGVMFADRKDKIYAIRRDSPLLVSPCEDGVFMESDVSAVIRYTGSFTRLEEGEVAVLEGDGARFYGKDGNEIEKRYESVEWDVEAAEKGGFMHFMLKEIYEEPSALVKTVRPRIRDGLPEQGLWGMSDGELALIDRIHIVACGTAMHAGLVGKYVIEKLARVPVCVEIASEWRYRDPLIGDRDVVLIISQSGETADTLAALRLAKKRGVRTVAIVNVTGSSIAREADFTLYTWAGPEIAVASTKAYTVQTALLYLMAISLARVKGTLPNNGAQKPCEALLSAGDAIKKTLQLDTVCASVARKYCKHGSIFFIGRGIDYAVAVEAALKMKEISYIHCEAYAAGEMKHGTISLIEEGTPVFAFATQGALLEKTFSNVKEVVSRGASVVLFAAEGTEIPPSIADDVIYLPRMPEELMVFPAATAAQLLAYHTAVQLGADVDKPRNLAKSVTVE